MSYENEANRYINQQLEASEAANIKAKFTKEIRGKIRRAYNSAQTAHSDETGSEQNMAYAHKKGVQAAMEHFPIEVIQDEADILLTELDIL